MAENKLKEFVYIQREDYDKERKINGEKIKAFSKQKMEDISEDEGYEVIGETFEKKKRDRDKDLGRIELADKWLYVSENGSHNKFFREQGEFIQVEGGNFIALLKLKLIPLLLIAALVIAGIVGILFAIFGLSNDPNIEKCETELLTISGTVYKEEVPVEGAELSLQKGNEEVGKATTDEDGNYLISDVEKGSYNLVCTYGDSVLTKIATVTDKSIVVDYYFPANDLHDVEEITDYHKESKLPKIKKTKKKTEVKALVNILEKATPAIAVGGLAEEAILDMVVSKEIDLIFSAKALKLNKVPDSDRRAIEEICGDLVMSYYDFSVVKETYLNGEKESSTKVTSTKMVLEIAVPYDSTRSVGTYVFRYHGEKATRLKELKKKPTGNYKDGTYYYTDDYVYIYASRFSTYAIGNADTGQVVKGNDTITYDDTAEVNLNTEEISMMYRHDEDSSNDAQVQIYIVGEDSDLLIAESGKIPVGYEITKMTLKSGISNMPSVGTYKGIMRITYLGTESNSATKVDIPLSVAITK